MSQITLLEQERFGLRSNLNEIRLAGEDLT